MPGVEGFGPEERGRRPPVLSVLAVVLWMGFRLAWVAMQAFLGLVLLLAIVNFDGGWALVVILLGAALLIYLNMPSVRSFCRLRARE